MLKKTHRQKRLEFAHYHGNWTVEDFKRVLWCMYGRREEPISDRTTTLTVKHGGGNNLMVWGCMG